MCPKVFPGCHGAALDKLSCDDLIICLCGASGREIKKETKRERGGEKVTPTNNDESLLEQSDE